MKIQWLGHSAFLLQTQDGTRIVMDPYESGAYGGGIGYGPIELEADVVTVSHDQHEDHNHTDTVRGEPLVLKGPGEDTARGISFRRVHTYHDQSEGSERGENYVFCIRADGMQVVHAGDLGHVLNASQVEAIGQPDVLLIPIGGTFTVDPAEATQVIDQLKPRIVVPMHFKTPKCGFPLETVEAFLTGKENVHRAGDSVLEVLPDALPAPTRIVVLDHAL